MKLNVYQIRYSLTLHNGIKAGEATVKIAAKDEAAAYEINRANVHEADSQVAHVHIISHEVVATDVFFAGQVETPAKTKKKTAPASDVSAK